MQYYQNKNGIDFETFQAVTVYTAVVPNHIEDTDDVKAAKAEFEATFAEVKARKPVATAYIADTSEVSDAYR